MLAVRRHCLYQFCHCTNYSTSTEQDTTVATASCHTMHTNILGMHNISLYIQGHISKSRIAFQLFSAQKDAQILVPN